MSNELLYELHFPMEFIIIQFFFLMIFFFIPRGYSFIVKDSSLEGDRATKRKVYIISYVAIIVLAVNFFSFDVRLIDMYKQIDEMYVMGRYESTVGEIKDFIPSSIADKGRESFSVNGIAFEYDMLEYKIGYQKIKSLGGKIKNGQQVKIKYVVYNGENRIIYLEQL